MHIHKRIQVLQANDLLIILQPQMRWRNKLVTIKSGEIIKIIV